MDEILDFVKKLSEERQLVFFHYRNEIWLSGYKDNIKIDIFIKLFKDGKVKLIYELPFERKVALFLNRDNLIQRLKLILNYEVV